jgi:cold-inducible RNA-binding protein
VPLCLTRIALPPSRVLLFWTGMVKTVCSNEIQPIMSTKLFVGNLSFNLTENDLQDAFSPFGTVVEVNVMMDRATNRPRGFAFVTMSSKEEAEKAIQGLHGKQIDGRPLTVNEARPREDRPRGDGGGGGGGGGGRDRGPRRPYSR